MRNKFTLSSCLIAKHSLFLIMTAMISQISLAQNWLTTGNNGLTSANFIGTNDANDLIFKTNGLQRGRINSSGVWRFGNATNFAGIDSTGTLSFGGKGVFQVANNKYVFQTSTKSKRGLFFSSTLNEYEFRDSANGTIFSLNAGNGNGAFKGSLKIGAYTLPAIDGIAGQVLKTDGAGNISFGDVNTGWSLTGNAGTSSALNFIGTTDLQNLAFRSNNVEVMRITTTERVGIGTTSPVAKLHINTQSGEDGFRVQIVGLTKFWVTDNGGVSVGALIQGPPDGLYVDSTIGISTFAPKAKLHIIHGNEATLTNGGSIMMGDSASTNIVMDENEIQARNDAKNSALFLNPAGGIIQAGGRLQVINGTEASLTGGGFVALGDTASSNMLMDQNEIQARNGTAATVLFLNPGGGLVRTGTDLDVDGTTINLGSIEAISDGGSNIIASNSSLVPTADNGRSLGNSTNRWIDVWAVDGTINTSDARDKKNIRDLNYGLNDVMKLHPVKFNWKTGVEQGDKIGLIAQELQKVIPEVVKDHEFKTNEATGKNEKVASGKLGVMYSDLIPVLINAIQQQQKQIDAQQKQIEELKAMMVSNQVDGNRQQSTLVSSASLQQNIPNPFTHTTTIGYSLPQKFSSAQIIITDKSGKTIKTINISGSGKGSLNVDASTLASGAYQYALYVDGKLIATKQMVLTR